MMSASATVNVNVGEVDVTFHCVQADDRASYRVPHAGDQVSIFLTGTPEQLGAFADAIVRAASRHAIETIERAGMEVIR